MATPLSGLGLSNVQLKLPVLIKFFSMVARFRVYSLAETPHPPPAFWLIYKGAIGQPRKTTSLCDLLAPSQHSVNKGVHFGGMSQLE
jgi:hypothetical protein